MHVIPVVAQLKILGIWFTRKCSLEDHYSLNFKPQLAKVKGVCESWSARSLSIKGKVTLVNSLMTSLLQYQCASIHTTPQVYKEYRKLITDFIWSGRKAKVAYSTLILPVAQGGLQLIDLNNRVRVSVLQWVRRLIKRPKSNAALSLSHILQANDLTSYFLYKLARVPTEVSSDPFYFNLFQLWNEYHAFYPPGEDDICREIIWKNRFITCEGAVLSGGPWESKDISRINDICQPGEGRLCSHTEIKAKYNVQCTFLDALKLRLSIP